jgi:hypothetical protein
MEFTFSAIVVSFIILYLEQHGNCYFRDGKFLDVMRMGMVPSIERVQKVYFAERAGKSLFTARLLMCFVIGSLSFLGWQGSHWTSVVSVIVCLVQLYLTRKLWSDYRFAKGKEHSLNQWEKEHLANYRKYAPLGLSSRK